MEPEQASPESDVVTEGAVPEDGAPPT
jgi:hypothetical protein